MRSTCGPLGVHMGSTWGPLWSTGLPQTSGLGRAPPVALEVPPGRPAHSVRWSFLGVGCSVLQEMSRSYDVLVMLRLMLKGNGSGMKQPECSSNQSQQVSNLISVSPAQAQTHRTRSAGADPWEPQGEPQGEPRTSPSSAASDQTTAWATTGST